MNTKPISIDEFADSAYSIVLNEISERKDEDPIGRANQWMRAYIEGVAGITAVDAMMHRLGEATNRIYQLQICVNNHSGMMRIMPPLDRGVVGNESMVVAINNITAVTKRNLTLQQLLRHKAKSFEESRVPLNETLNVKGDSFSIYFADIGGFTKLNWRGKPGNCLS